MKKLVSLLLCSLLLLSAAALADGIGTKDAPVVVNYLNKDVAPDDPDMQAVEAAIEAGMAAQGNYVDLVIMEAPAGKYVDVVPLAFRTGEINPDLIYFQGNTDGPVVGEGLLEDLTPYIEASAYIKDLLPAHSKVRLESQPYLLWIAPAKVFAPVMRADVLEQAPSKDAFLADPTPEAYAKLLKELMDAGVCQMGITVDGSLARLDAIFNHAFGVTSTIMMNREGRWVYSKVTENEKNKLAFYADLYKQGILDPDYITKAWDTMEQAFYEGQAAMIAGTAGEVIQVYNNKMVETHGADAQLVALPAAKGENQAFISIDVTKEERGFAINATSDDAVKQAAFAILDYMASPEGRMLDKLGVEDVHYTMDGETAATNEAWLGYWAKFFPTTSGLPETLTLATPILSQPAQDSLDMAAKYYADDINVIVPEDMQPQLAAMNAIYTEYANEIVRGVRPISDFDEFVAKFNEAGGLAFSRYFDDVIK